MPAVVFGLVLRLVLEQGMGIERILVVTYTKAATAELRDKLERVAEACEAWEQLAQAFQAAVGAIDDAEAAKPLRRFDPANPDYNVKYYLKKLDQNLKKVKGYLPVENRQDGLF